MTHLFIAGHGTLANGKFDPGATGIISKGEHRYMKEDLFPAIKRHLPKGHDIVFFDSYSVVSRGNLAALVKQYGADQVTEFHYDAATASARGGHVIIHSAYSPDKTDLALRDAIKSMVGVRYSHKGYSGISGRSNLGNVNRARNNNITYRLIELGFGTNKTDADIMVNQVDEYAKAIIKAVGVSPTSSSGSSGSSSSGSSSGSGSSSSTSSSGVQWVGTDDKGKCIEAIAPSVNYYDTQRWTNPSGSFKKGEGWIVDNLYRVNGSLQYRVQNSNGDLYYITARKDLVRIVDGTSKGSTSSSSGRSVSKGSRVTAKRLYTTSASTKNVRSTPISGIVDTVNNSWRNEIRLKNSRGNYIGFTRRQDLQ
ncbi:N-acetylmuramoyl-L-alanine amidase [Oceanobacillus jeddahense]|uniref:N-acetylmuramoyl-L-alanine amidase n=1 Tax=Oceanobacillus jeddahense TaxID=1462527 RepID=UPI0006946BD5|nr:N-acetylmuramoyl-L-alanine amidase [Oceanobacillus jeddahense]